MIKHFVMLGTESDGIVLPLMDEWPHDVIATFDSRVDATEAAERTTHGKYFGFNVYTTEVPTP